MDNEKQPAAQPVARIDPQEVMQRASVSETRIAQQCADSAWQPIETAPRDGSLILGTDGRTVGAMWWAPEREPGYPWAFVGEWMGKAQDNAWQDGQHGAQHWMEMPEPPNLSVS